MIKTTVFLSILAMGTALITLWVIVDVVKKLTAKTDNMIQEHDLAMMDMVAKHNETTKHITTDMHDRNNDIFVLQDNISKIKQHLKNEKARVRAIIVDSEKSGNHVKGNVRSSV
jgi:peptidoglycan hydrolase CwlO-like protein